jgi:hypothetical protein
MDGILTGRYVSEYTYAAAPVNRRGSCALLVVMAITGFRATNPWDFPLSMNYTRSSAATACSGEMT